MGDGLSGSAAMKYHYFHGRFTYSVKRSGRSPGWDLSRSPPAASRLSSCIEARAVPARGRQARRKSSAFFFEGAHRLPRAVRCSSFLKNVVRPSFLSLPSISGNLFGGAIRAEDIAGWGV